MKRTKVAIIRTTDYSSLFEAIRHCIQLTGAQLIRDAKTIFLKPNCLQDSVKAATTSEVIRNTIKVIQSIKEGQDYQLYIGDSPGLLAKPARLIFKNLGIMDIIEETRIEYIEFDGGAPPLDIQIPDGVRLKETKIVKIIQDVDLIVNLPRLKTHILTIYTGAVKNYWGIQPGGIKPKNHLKGRSTETFSQVLADLYSVIADRPQLCIMDAIDAMEGNGPSSGPLRNLNLIIGGLDPVAVDAVAITIVGHDPLQEVPHIRICNERGLGIGNLADIEIVGTPLSEVKLTHPLRFPGRGLAWAGSLFAPIIYRYTKKIPRLRRIKCIKCGNCEKVCPNGAITLTPYPRFNRKKCISCLCCAETCPEDAIRVVSAGIRGVLGFQ
ncbi:MAG: DUF362 domain-containing protein [Candidatus Helarchaeota archaeon]